MASFNKTILAGNLTRDPELKQTQSGESVATFSLAVGRKGKSGEVDFLDIVAWGTTAELAARYLKKGSGAVVCGRIQQRRWTDKQGGKHSSFEIVAEEIVFLGGSESTAKPETAPPNPAMWGHGTPQSQFVEIDQDDENLPF